MKTDRDFLVEQLESIPAFRAFLRSVESRRLAALDLPRPILDLGCGDGTFAQATFSEPLDFGIDPSAHAVGEARQRGMHCDLRVGEGGKLPYADGQFATVLSNSVVEHIPDIDGTLEEVRRVLRPGGLFVFTTPSEHFAEFLFFADLFRRIGLKRLSKSYENYFNRISWHYRTDSASVWTARLERYGLQVRESHTYFSRSASHVFDLCHYYSAVCLIYRKLTGRWIIAPFRANFALIEPLLRHYYDEPAPAQGAYLYFLCERE